MYTAENAPGVAVLLSGDADVPGPLTGLPTHQDNLDTVIGRYSRLIVVGADADLGAVLTRLLRTDRLDVEPVGAQQPSQYRPQVRVGADDDEPRIPSDDGVQVVLMGRQAGQRAGHVGITGEQHRDAGCVLGRIHDSSSQPAG